MAICNNKNIWEEIAAAAYKNKEDLRTKKYL